MNERRLYRGKAVGNSAAKDGEWVTGGHVPDYKLFGDKEAPPTPCIYRSDIAWHVIVDPATVGQCVGIKDKNGALIFEGDIAIFKNGRHENKAVITWRSHDYLLAWYLEFGDSRLLIMPQYEGDLEVIGNIHDNLELLCICQPQNPPGNLKQNPATGMS